jgi:hypothetical protein
MDLGLIATHYQGPTDEAHGHLNASPIWHHFTIQSVFAFCDHAFEKFVLGEQELSAGQVTSCVH